MGVLQGSPQEEHGQEQHLQGGHGTGSPGEGLCVWASLLRGDQDKHKCGGDLFITSLGVLPRLLSPPPTSFPRPMEFDAFEVIRQKSSLGIFAAFQRIDTQLGTEVDYVTHFFHRGHFLVPQLAEPKSLHPKLRAPLL